MIVYRCQQGSSEWLRLRMGRPTASSFDRIITPKTRKLSSQASAYANDLLAELMLGRPLDGPKSFWMERGTALEGEARAFYEFERGVAVQQVGFITTDDGRAGCSPDGLVGDEGLLELKVPSPSVHCSFLLADRGVDDAYQIQLQGQLWIAERKWVDICSYHPGLPEALVRVERDEELIGQLALLVNDFCNLLEARKEKLIQRGWLKEKADEPADGGRFFIDDEDVNAWLSRVKAEETRA